MFWKETKGGNSYLEIAKKSEELKGSLLMVRIRSKVAIAIYIVLSHARWKTVRRRWKTCLNFGGLDCAGGKARECNDIS